MDESPARPPDPLEQLLPKPWFQPRTVLWLLLGLTVVLVAIIFGGRAAYGTWRMRQATALAARAAAHLESGRNQEGMDALNEAYRTYPSAPAVLRLVARSLQAPGADPSKAVYFWKQLLNSGEATTADRIALAQCLLAAEQRHEAETVLATFTSDERATPAVMELESDLLRAGGRAVEANTLLRRVLQLRPDDPESALRLVTLDLDVPFREVQDRAVGKLWEIARSTAGTSLRAMALLAEHQSLTPLQARELLELAGKQDARRKPVYYQILSALIRLEPGERTGLMEKELAASANQPPEECLDLLKWLIAQGEHERVLQRVPRAEAAAVPSLFGYRAEALAGLQRWDEVRALLRSASGMRLSSSYLALLQARCTRGLQGPPEQLRGELQEACRTALMVRDWVALQRAAAFAGSAGEPDIALAALEEASKVPQLRLPALEMLLTLRSGALATEALLSAAREAQAARPSERAHRERLLYLKLLVGLEMESIAHDLPTLIAEDRISPEAGRFLGALVAWRQSDAALLRERLPLIDPRKLPAGQRAAYVGMLCACGQIAEAFALAENITRSILLPEEERLLLKVL